MSKKRLNELLKRMFVWSTARQDVTPEAAVEEMAQYTQKYVQTGRCLVCYKPDGIVKSHQMDGTVKSPRCKLSKAKSRPRGRANLEE
jgi:hypothetical protein